MKTDQASPRAAHARRNSNAGILNLVSSYDKATTGTVTSRGDLRATRDIHEAQNQLQRTSSSRGQQMAAQSSPYKPLMALKDEALMPSSNPYMLSGDASVKQLTDDQHGYAAATSPEASRLEQGRKHRRDIEASIGPFAKRGTEQSCRTIHQQTSELEEAEQS
jgi:hypothetical protein